MTHHTYTLPIALTPELDLSIDAATAMGASLAEPYQQATPFPHVVIDNFLPDELIARLCADFPVDPTADETLYERGYKGQLKRQINPNHCSPWLRSVFAVFNSAPMLNLMERLTGIEGLIPDPYFVGGGLHETRAGGFLGVHSDFRLNKKLKVQRRINAIIYLNPDWEESYGGHLELWDKPMTRCLERVLPVYNRCVIFNTDEDSNHGHPEPLTCPPDRSRRSIALYYYTASPAEVDPNQRHKTHYKPRPKDLLSFKYHLSKLLRKKR
ncbi:2OG-Fe(II) oxygenase [Pseudomonas sp. dw_358]|uniref:2OG-Fe(II) oxygenase n=1 Tax=Pseudomonas sp. dw_358 TaxID=2720083 RepID=UPI001BD45465|nr:2OG-Fe(II) oxygenase [Pseudomonas sp. dw_358]